MMENNGEKLTNPNGESLVKQMKCMHFALNLSHSTPHTQIPTGRCLTTLLKIELPVHAMLYRKWSVNGLAAGTNHPQLLEMSIHTVQNSHRLQKHPFRFSKASARSHSHCLSSCISCQSHTWNGKIKQSDVTSWHYKTIHHYQQMQIWGLERSDKPKAFFWKSRLFIGRALPSPQQIAPYSIYWPWMDRWIS